MKEQVLQEFGLNPRETKVYLALLKEKSTTASRLAKLSKINRTTTYLELENLLQKGLANYVIKDSKRYYQPTDPEKLIDILEMKKTRIQEIMPELTAMHRTVAPFQVEVYEGKEGIKSFYLDIFNSCDEFFVLGATGNAFETLKYHYPHVIKKFLKAKKKEKALADFRAKEKMGQHPKKLVDVKYLPKNYETKVTTVIYGDKIGIQSLQKNNIYVVVIKDKLLKQTYKNIFELLWNTL